jgi:thiamine monophosphate kinase
VVIELERVPLAAGAELSDLGFGEDYELLAAVKSPSGHTIVGHCEEGTGVVLTLNGEPYELGGWQHFR